MEIGKRKLSEEEMSKYIQFLKMRGCSDESIIDPICEYLLTGKASGMVKLLLKNTSGDDYAKTLLLVEVEPELL